MVVVHAGNYSTLAAGAGDGESDNLTSGDGFFVVGGRARLVPPGKHCVKSECFRIIRLPTSPLQAVIRADGAV